MMAKSISNKLQKIPFEIQKITINVLLEFAKQIMENIPSSLFSTYRLEVKDGGVIIWTDNVFAAYFEFGTGNKNTVRGGISAEEYLPTQPQEVSDEAKPFFKTGEGTIPAVPYLFPAYYKVKDKIAPEIDKRIQEFFDSI